MNSLIEKLVHLFSTDPRFRFLSVCSRRDSLGVFFEKQEHTFYLEFKTTIKKNLGSTLSLKAAAIWALFVLEASQRKCSKCNGSFYKKTTYDFPEKSLTIKEVCSCCSILRLIMLFEEYKIYKYRTELLVEGDHYLEKGSLSASFLILYLTNPQKLTEDSLLKALNKETSS